MSRPRALVLTHTDQEQLWLFAEWLPAAGLELDVVRLHAGEDLPSLDGYAALLVMGGPMGTYDTATVAWLEPVMQRLREAVEADLPTFGVCLGGQLLAQACGGFVAPSESGPELGLRLIGKRDAADADPVFGGLPMTPVVVQWHSDEIVELPPKATLLASSPRFAHQAFRLGEHVYGVQFHPEAPPELAGRWAAADVRAGRLSEAEAQALLDPIRQAAEELAEVWRPVLERFVALVLRQPPATP